MPLLTVNDLAKIIKKNKGCVAIIDNDTWYLLKTHRENLPEDASYEEEEANRLATSDDMVYSGSGYGRGSNCGGDILQALAKIVGIEVESV